MRTLALETSHTPGEIALLRDDEILYESRLPDHQRTTESFAIAIQTGLRTVGWSAGDLEMTAVCEGPGSFTGLRIGVTAAKTLAYATHSNVIAINTLDVLAAQAVDAHPLSTSQLYTVMDAQRRQLFVGHYRVGEGDRAIMAVDPVCIVDATAWLADLPQGTNISGSGLARYTSSIAHLQTTSEATWRVRAAWLGKLAQQRFQPGQSPSCLDVVPNYHRPSAAEEKTGA